MVKGARRGKPRQKTSNKNASNWPVFVCRGLPFRGRTRTGLAPNAVGANNSEDTGRTIIERSNPAVMRKDPAELVQLIWPVLGVVAAIAVLIAVIFRVRAWLRDDDGSAAADHNLLSQYREMLQEGELTEEEFRLIKGRLASRITGTPSPPGDRPKDS